MDDTGMSFMVLTSMEELHPFTEEYLLHFKAIANSFSKYLNGHHHVAHGDLSAKGKQHFNPFSSISQDIPSPKYALKQTFSCTQVE